jgi:putative FmdB family regulatory protein
MPTYDFRCGTCGVFSAVRRIADRDADCACPDCGTPAARTLSMPSLSLMAGSTRAGHRINEQAAHAPRRSSEYRHVHGPSCGCGSSSRKTGAAAGSAAGTGTSTAAAGLKGNAAGRPWMISH